MCLYPWIVSVIFFLRSYPNFVYTFVLSNMLTGGSLNPARSLGPAIFANVWSHHYIYWIGPLIGATVAGGFYRYELVWFLAIVSHVFSSRLIWGTNNRQESGDQKWTISFDCSACFALSHIPLLTLRNKSQIELIRTDISTMFCCINTKEFVDLTWRSEELSLMNIRSIRQASSKLIET